MKEQPTVSDIVKASSDAVEAARQGESFAMMLAAVQAAQQERAPACQHPQTPVQQSSGSVTKWLAIGIGGSFLAVALAVSMVAFAIGAVAATICVVVLRSVWADFTKAR